MKKSVARMARRISAVVSLPPSAMSMMSNAAAAPLAVTSPTPPHPAFGSSSIPKIAIVSTNGIGAKSCKSSHRRRLPDFGKNISWLSPSGGRTVEPAAHSAVPTANLAVPSWLSIRIVELEFAKNVRLSPPELPMLRTPDAWSGTGEDRIAVADIGGKSARQRDFARVSGHSNACRVLWDCTPVCDNAVAIGRDTPAPLRVGEQRLHE